MVIVLDTTEEEVLRFILDNTIEYWTDSEPEQLDVIINDPAWTNFDSLLAAAASVTELVPLARRIRARMCRKGS